MIWHSGTKPDLPALTEWFATSMPGFLGIEFVDAGDDWLAARMPVNERTHQPFGRLHGGASVALAETVATMGGALTLDSDKQTTVGLEINANHIRPAMSGWVTATATAESIGRTTQIWTVRITNEQDKLVCLSRITLAVISLGLKG